MTIRIDLLEDDIRELISKEELYISSNKSIHIFNSAIRRELVMNYKGLGYKPTHIALEFEYDNSIEF